MQISDKFASTNFRSSGFDYLRLILASAVIAQHGVNVVNGIDAARELFFSNWRILLFAILPAFFALSGFLVAGSLIRCKTLISFLGLRVLRLVPALGFEVFLSALIMGPIFTTVSLREYFSSQQFFSYFLNVIGWIHYKLPGVFVNNKWPEIVNTQLWTVPFELECYVVLAMLAVAGIAWKRQAMLYLIILVQLLLAGNAVLRHHDLTVLVSGRILVFCFICGVAAYLYQDRLPFNFGLAALSAGMLIPCALLPGGAFFIAMPATYLTIYLGVLNPKKIPFLFSGDFSYGMYLYGFPIQQAYAQIYPSSSVLFNVIASLCTAFAFAHLSWYLIEKPCLQRRTNLMLLEDRIVGTAKFLPAGRLFLSAISRRRQVNPLAQVRDEHTAEPRSTKA